MFLTLLYLIFNLIVIELNIQILVMLYLFS